MSYSEFSKVYDELSSTTKKLEKVDILSKFLKVLDKKGKKEWIYLLRGKVFADYDPREFGISDKLVIKAISKASGIDQEKILVKVRKVGDLGEIAKEFLGNRKQSTLFTSKLNVDKVFDNLRKLVEIEGKGSVDKKLGLISELLNSASDNEAKYVARTLLGDLRVGVAEGIMRDAISKAFLGGEKEDNELIEESYDLANDYAIVFEAAKKGKKALKKIDLIVGRPIKVMLPVKVTEIKEAFRICGTPAAVEHKYDGFRVLINKDANGKISLFTRRLENVTNQFPDVVEIVKKYVKGKSFILDSEVVGYNPKSGKYKPFEAISQRIKRKYDIDKLVKTLPVEINSFDIIYHNGEALINKTLRERRKILEKVVKVTDKKIRTSAYFETGDEKEALKFYKKALSLGEEGIMIKKLDALYRPGRRVGYWVKMKPQEADLDLVIVGAEYGSGKRGGLLTSYILACKSGNKYLEVGKVASGLKEKKEEGTTYEELTNLLKPLVISEKGKVVKVKPKLIVSVTYQNIQRSPSYDSGFALRFPKVTAYRPDRGVGDIATFEDIQKEVRRSQQRGEKRGLG